MSMNQTLTKGYNPIRQTSLIRPIELAEIPKHTLHSFYIEEDLTEYEILILEYIGMLNIHKGGWSQLSFQGLKRLLNLHQAKLTKAINRLIEKQLLDKDDGVYTLSDEGTLLFNKLYKDIDFLGSRIPNKVFSHVAWGQLKGYFGTTEDIHRLVATHLTGKWFSNFRFIAKVYYKEYSEICWMSIDGSTSISLLAGPKNEVKIVHSSPSYYDAEMELELLVDKIAQTIEDELGLIIDINSLAIYENDEIMA